MNNILIFEEFIVSKTIKQNIDKYDSYYQTYGDSRTKSVAWVEENSQDKNFEIVALNIDDGDSILDYGCGLGDFIQYLDKKGKDVSDYLGVDINKNYIERAKLYYPENNFKLINRINDISGKYDTVCAIGVFTWFITRKDFIRTIYSLYEACNKQVLLTCLYRPYVRDTGYYWKSHYRYYNEELFRTLFPKLDMKFTNKDGTLLVKINKV